MIKINMDGLANKLIVGILFLYLFAYLAPGALNALFNNGITDPTVSTLIPLVGLVFVVAIIYGIWKGFMQKK